MFLKAWWRPQMSCFVHKLKEIMKNVTVCNLDDDDSESVTRMNRCCWRTFLQITDVLLYILYVALRSILAQLGADGLVWFRHKKLLVMVRKRSSFGRHKHNWKTLWCLLTKCWNAVSPRPSTPHPDMNIRGHISRINVNVSVVCRNIFRQHCTLATGLR